MTHYKENDTLKKKMIHYMAGVSETVVVTRHIWLWLLAGGGIFSEM